MITFRLYVVYTLPVIVIHTVLLVSNSTRNRSTGRKTRPFAVHIIIPSCNIGGGQNQTCKKYTVRVFFSALCSLPGAKGPSGTWRSISGTSSRSNASPSPRALGDTTIPTFARNGPAAKKIRGGGGFRERETQVCQESCMRQSVQCQETAGKDVDGSHSSTAASGTNRTSP